MASDVLFAGEFDLLKSYNTFNQFIEKIEKRLATFNQQANATGGNVAAQKAQLAVNARVEELYNSLSATSARAAEKVQESQNRIRAAMNDGRISIDSGNRAIISLNKTLEAYERKLRDVELREEEEVKSNKNHVLSLRRLEDTYADLGQQIQRVESQLNSGNEQFREADKTSQKFFKGLVIGGFALQQFGGFFIANVTQPLIQMIKGIGDGLLEFDSFNERLLQTAGKTQAEVKEINDIALEVAKRPNITLRETIDLFGKLEELTKGQILTTQLKSIGEGLSVALSGTRPNERASLLGELMQVLSGGDTSNLNKVLNNAELLKKEIGNLINAPVTAGNIEKAGFTQTEVVMKALENLSKQNAAVTISNQIDNLTDRIYILGASIGELYKGRLKALISYIDTSVLPMLENLTDWLKIASPLVKDLLLVFTGLLVAIGPIAYALGTLAVVTGGLVYLFDTLSGFIGLVTESMITIEATTSGLAVTAGTTGSVLAGLTTIFEYLIAVIIPFALELGAVIAVLVYTISTSQILQGEFSALGNTIWSISKSVINSLVQVGKSLYELGKLFAWVASYPIAGALIVALEALNIALSPTLALLGTLSAALTSVGDAVSSTKSWTTIFYELILSLTELGRAFAETLHIAELVDKIAGLFTDATYEKDHKRLQDYLKGQKDSTLALKEKEVEEKKAKANSEALTKSIEKITDAIEKETGAIRAQADAFDQQREAAKNAVQKSLEDSKVADTTRRDSKYDLANPEQASQLITDLKTKGRYEIDQKRRDLVLDEAKKETEFRSSLYSELTKFDFVDKRLNGIISDAFRDNQNSGDILQAIYSRLPEGVEADKIRGLIQNQLLPKYRSLTDSYSTAQLAIQELLAQQATAEKDLKDQIAEANRKLALEQSAGAVGDLTTLLNTQLLNLERDITDIDQSQISFSEKYIKIQAKLISIFDIKKKILLAESNLAIEQNRNDSTAQTRISNETSQKTDSLVTESSERQKTLSAKYLTNIKEAQKIVDEASAALFTFKESVNTLDVYSVDTYLKAADANRQLSDAGSILSSLGRLGLSGKLNDIIQKSGITNKLPSALVATDLNASISRQIKETEALINSILDLDINAILRDDKNLNGADILNLLQKLTAAMKTLKETQTNIGKDREDNAKRIADKQNRLNEMKLEELKTTAEILDLEKQINDTKDERNRGTQGGFIQQVYDALTNGRAAAYKADLARLTIAQRIGDLEVEIALSRLEIEIKIQVARMRAAKISEDEITEYEKHEQKEIELLKRKGTLGHEQIEEQKRVLSKYGTTLGSVLTQTIGDAFKKIFKKKPKDEPAVSKEATDETAKNTQTQVSWLDKLTGKMGKVRDITLAFGAALENLSDLSLQSILKAIQAELDALAKHALIKALEMSAIALTALVFGDHTTAKRAGIAAAAWGAVAVAAKVGSAIVGLGIKQDDAAAQSASDRSAGTASTAQERKRLARQQAEALKITFDIRMDNGIILKKTVEAVNANTQLTTLTSNQQAGFRFSPA